MSIAAFPAKDAEALAALDQLLDLAPIARADHLACLARGNSELHAQLQRMLIAAENPTSSVLLANPVSDALNDAHRLASTALAAGQFFAGYRLIRELGRGGMAVVWLAARADGVIKREVAIKLPLLTLGTPDQAERFARERDALAPLSHPNIARLYDAGVAESGQPFIVLEFVDGLPIGEYCDRNRLPIRDRLRLFEQVIAAVDHAHHHLIVHRDLKPANILVDSTGQVKLLDFGIAKLLADPNAGALQLTQFGGCALTPRYAAPEQMSGEPITTLTDVYALGVVLHELLTGSPPYDFNSLDHVSIAHMAMVVLHTEPTRPSAARLDATVAQARGAASINRLRSELAGDLDTLVGKALRKKPAERYTSIERFGKDIASYLALRPIEARPPSITYSLRRLVQRNLRASVAAGLGAILVLGSGALAWQQRQSSQQHAVRTAAVRDFMFDLINDAEPDESQTGSQITGKQMIDGAVRRARRDFSAEPQLQGELLAELGRMYTRIDEPTPARRVLGEAIEILEAHAAPNDAALNKARAHLANLLFADGESAPATALAQTARRACTLRDSECAKARAYAGAVLAQISAHQGHTARALADMRQYVVDTALGFGEPHAETALARMSFAIIARNAGRLQEASEMLDQALASSAQQVLRATDRIELLRTKAVLDMDLGRYGSARDQLSDLLERTTQPGERALQLRLLANAEFALGKPASAIKAADIAIALGEAEPADTEMLRARQSHARALALLGNGTAAIAEIQIVISSLQGSGLAADAPDLLQARRIRGEVLAREGRYAAASEELRWVAAAHARLNPSWDIEWAETLELLGSVARLSNRPGEALDWHRAARRRFSVQLSKEHASMVRNGLYIAAARMRAHDSARTAAEFRAAAAATKRFVPTTSLWSGMIDAFDDPARCPSGGPALCAMIL